MEFKIWWMLVAWAGEIELGSVSHTVLQQILPSSPFFASKESFAMYVKINLLIVIFG